MPCQAFLAVLPQLYWNRRVAFQKTQPYLPPYDRVLALHLRQSALMRVFPCQRFPVVEVMADSLSDAMPNAKVILGIILNQHPFTCKRYCKILILLLLLYLIFGWFYFGF